MSENKHYAYVTYNDLKTISERDDNRVMAVRVPPKIKLKVWIDVIKSNVITFIHT